MKPQIFNCHSCHKFVISSSWLSWVYLLPLASLSYFIWVVFTPNQPASAQVLSKQEPVSSGELLLVPQVPGVGAKNNLRVAPPPPDESTNSTGTASISNIKSPVVGVSPISNIQQIENSLIQKATGRKPTAKSRYRSVLPKLASAGDAPNLGLELLPISNTSNNSTNSSTGNLFAQNLNQSDSQPVTTQEFSAPGTVTPTFNQFLSPTNTSESAVVPLPPILGEESQSVPTFNQVLSDQSGTQGSVNSRLPASQQTFNQFLNSDKSQNQQFGKETLSGNGQRLSSDFSAEMNVNQTPPTFSQLFNSQGGTAPTIDDPKIAQTQVVQQRPNQTPPLIKSTALTQSSLRVQGVYLTQGEDSSARARLTGVYPLTPQALFGATIDLVSNGSSFDDSRNEGLNINEVYFATSLGGLPNLRFAIGQLDLTSYFDRNSFAKDGASQFFNPVFQTNPALSVTGISSRPALLANWSVTDNIDAKAAVFSSADKLSDFSLDGFAGEIGIRYGNAIIRGTYATDRDSGNRDTFAEGFSIARGNNQFGIQKDDREEAYGLNAEVFVPNLKMGLFGRYGRYENRDLGQGAETYILGASFLDLFTPDDRLGIAYGRALSNDSLRRGEQPDVVELFYDFKFLPNLRLGFTVQGRDSFEETVLGVRVKSDFDVTPRGRSGR